MTNIEVKNEADYLVKSNSLKNEMFEKMCTNILANYNKLTGQHLKINDKHDTALLSLFDKLNHIVFNIYSPQSVVELLTRISLKPAKVIAKPGFKYKHGYDKPEIYGKGHFRWNHKAYTLNDNELQAIRVYLGLHVKQTTKKVYLSSDTPKPDFSVIPDYKDQAESFLQWTKTTFTAKFKEHSIYFTGDKETRDIYTIVLENTSHRYRFTFGQSVNNSLKGESPTAYDVLACLTKYDVGTFDNFCSEYGYEADSRTAYKTYKAVLKEWKNIELLFTPEQLEVLQEIN